MSRRSARVHLLYGALGQVQVAGFPLPQRKLVAYPPRVVRDKRVRAAVVGWVGGRVVAQLGQHRRDLSHVGKDVLGYLANPLGQGLHVDRFDDLVR